LLYFSMFTFFVYKVILFRHLIFCPVPRAFEEFHKLFESKVDIASIVELVGVHFGNSCFFFIGKAFSSPVDQFRYFLLQPLYYNN
jgi:hypothetical protein